VPPIYNVIVSNVPGPRGKLYFLGAEMEAYYPISALAHGQALNITVMSYAGGLYFGFTGCADKVPHLQRLAVYTGEALDELERTFGAAAPTGKPSGPRRKVAKVPQPAARRAKSGKPVTGRGVSAGAAKRRRRGAATPS
jgi:hypothetical protein